MVVEAKEQLPAAQALVQGELPRAYSTQLLPPQLNHALASADSEQLG